MQSFLMRPCDCLTFIWLEAPLPHSRLGVNAINCPRQGEVFSFEKGVLGYILSRPSLSLSLVWMTQVPLQLLASLAKDVWWRN